MEDQVIADQAILDPRSSILDPLEDFNNR